ncbi:DUF72 domain-containing protein [Uliginosibacterium sp. sgz301328]|uniref:DUF72 domain-containing protein n=1 Tax=Uliginosibacterium sp. sgz301328 TaxID=3243764 RepID=UPI00359DED25
MAILVGSASWADKGLIACKRFYPPGVSTAEARLRYYATQFPIVEVDSSYYAMPSVRNSQLWAMRTPDDFVMNVKAFRLLTGHHTDPSALPSDIRLALGDVSRQIYYRQVPAEIRDEMWRRFIDALAPLKAAGKLGAVLFQFPSWLINNREGRDHVAHCAERIQGHCMAIEFRHPSWFLAERRAATLEFERALGAVNVVVDEPDVADTSIPSVWEATHPSLAVVRLHGRNATSWNPRGIAHSSGRFNYEYPEDELVDIAAKIRRLAERVSDVHVILNTNNEDQGPRNARKLMRALQAGGG